MSKRFWRTPPELYAKLDDEFGFDFDPCPCPIPDGFDGLKVPWGKSNYVNPPFRRKDGLNGEGPTAFVHRAIAEHRKGNASVLTLPAQSYIMLALEAGAKIRSLGRVRWEEADTREPCKSPSPIIALIFDGE